MRIILASKSPRRSQLLRELGVDFTIIPACAETEPDLTLAPGEAVKKIASEKALDVAGKCSAGDLIIAADTLVYLDGAFLGKPNGEDDAKRMLASLSGRTHEVYTGVAVIFGGKIYSDFERTRVHFSQLSDEDIEWYVSTGEPMDKAGAYGAQGKGSVFVDGIDGDFYNVMGLPVFRLVKLIKAAGFKNSDIMKR